MSGKELNKKSVSIDDQQQQSLELFEGCVESTSPPSAILRQRKMCGEELSDLLQQGIKALLLRRLFFHAQDRLELEAHGNLELERKDALRRVLCNPVLKQIRDGGSLSLTAHGLTSKSSH
jgi:hypothetical protein